MENQEKEYFIKLAYERHYSGTFGPYKMMEDENIIILAKTLADCIKKFQENMDSEKSSIYPNQKGRKGIIQEIICGDGVVYRASDGQLTSLENIRDGSNFIMY